MFSLTRFRPAQDRKLDIRDPIHGDFTRLASELHMSIDNIAIISQACDPAEQLFTWWEHKSGEATVRNLQEILRRMGREDILDILSEDPLVA